MRYLLNAAVITSPGTYTYRLLTKDEAANIISQGAFDGGWESRIGYEATADHIERISGIRPAISREATTMENGSLAVVVRLKYRLQDPKQKANWQPTDDDWEYGLLVKHAGD